MELGLKRSFLRGPWHHCMRCDRKVHLDTMKWQRGLLLCKKCVDVKLLGERDVKIAQVLTDGKEEYTPAPKLRNPDHFIEEEDFLI